MRPFSPTSHSSRSRRPRTALVALALTTGLLLAGCGADDAEPTGSTGAVDPGAGSSSEPTGTDSPSAEPDEPTEPTSETPEPSEDPAAPAGAVLPVYFTGDSPLGPRLYREFHPGEAEVGSDAAALEAVQLLLAGDALDPDYGTLLRGVTVAAVQRAGSRLVVTLREDSVTSADKALSRAEAALAVQSLVYTAQAAYGERLPVQVNLADGRPTNLFDQPTSRGVRAAKQLAVLSLVNVTTPAEGDTVSGTMAVDGVASSFEATVPYFVTDAEGEEVLRDFATARGWVDRLYPWSAEVDVSDLEPGEYTFHAMTDDPTGGTEGPGPFEDTKTFTVS